MRYTKLMCNPRRVLMVIAVLGFMNVMGSPARAQSAEDRLLEILKSDATVADKCNACRELQTVGTERSIAALVELLTDPAISHTARMALEVMPYPAAGAGLRDAVHRTTGLTRSGIIDSLGERRDADAVTIVADRLHDEHPQVRAAAVAALGKIGTAKAIDVLSAEHAAAQGDERAAYGHALIRCADRMGEAGERTKAASIYVKLMQPTESRRVRLAALSRFLQGAGPETARMIVQAMSDEDPLQRQAAMSQLRNLSDQAFREVASSMSKMPADSQVAMLAAIRIRRDKSLASIALQAAASTDPAVRVAAIHALGMVGDASALPLLLQCANQDDPAGDAAQQALRLICDPKVDEQIAAMLRAEKDPLQRAIWIGLVESRQPTGAVALLLQEAENGHPAVRSRAMAALANLAGPSDVAAMASAVLRADKGAERDDAERAVMLVCQQIPDAKK
ncbi:MAG: HEAT repeat domain-containing protein, partial [Planctomycetes bacterium]|nr:HEAT repeat domain-containing protein [Planctomycetota bacterium]